MSKLTILGDWFYYEDAFYEKQQFPALISFDLNRIYEVLRIIDGKPLFLKDHYGRFLQSLEAIELDVNLDYKTLESTIYKIITKNRIDTCNLRFELILKENKPATAIYLVPFKYPLPEAYTVGVKLSTYQIERPNPHIKQSDVNDKVRKQIQSIYEERRVFEVVLIDHFDNITEGSRSNIFFIKNNTLYTPPSKTVLEGITRKKTLKIAEKLGVVILESKIPQSDLKDFDACFLTGTSPKILPVSSINHLTFNVNNTLLKKLMDEYNTLIQDCLN